jgi:hypothetical protein
MKRLLIATVALAALVVGRAEAQFTDITGWYGMTGTQTCLQTASGFNAAGQPNGSSTAFTTGLTGTYHFKADGTGEVTSQSLSILFPKPGVDIPDASVFTRIPSTFHYTMGANGGSFTFPSGGSFPSTVTTGPRAGELSTITNTPGFTGWIGDGAKELLLTNVNPSVDTQTYTGPPAPILPATFYRICQISETLVRLPHAP